MFTCKTRTVSVACAIAVLAFLLLSPAALFASSANTVNFTLKSDTADPSSVDVKVSFNMTGGQKVVLKTTEPSGGAQASGPAPLVQMEPVSGTSISVQPLTETPNAWLVTAATDGNAEVSYKVTDVASTVSTITAVGGEDPGGARLPRCIATPDLKAFMASDALLAPQNESGGYLSGSYAVKVELASGQSTLAPWNPAGRGAYSIGSTQVLLSNFLAWGKITTINTRASKPAINVGFSADYAGYKESDRSDYAASLMKIYDELVRVMGPRPDQSTVTVLVAGSGKYGTPAPGSESLRDSFLLFHGGSQLKGVAAAAASRGWLQLWNLWSLVPAKGGDAAWFQEGLPWFYGYRLAGKLSLSDANTAYAGYCRVYAEYLSGPGATTASLSTAEGSKEEQLLQTKGASVLADISARLSAEGTGAAKDIEWLLGQLASQFDNFKGKRYTLPDVSQLLEKATGTSWDAFFKDTVSGTHAVLASSFSTTDQFGTGQTTVGGKKLTGKGSASNWIYLAVAILVIFSIPIIFSGYIRRSIRLDVSMPKILPDDDDDEQDG